MLFVLFVICSHFEIQYIVFQTHGFTSKHHLKLFFFLVRGCFHPVCLITGNNGNEVYAVFQKKKKKKSNHERNS